MKKVNLALLTVLENDSLSCLVWGMWAKSPRIKSYVSTQREFRHCMHSAFLTQIIRRNSRQRWEQPPRAVFCRIGKAATDPCIGKASLFVLLPLPTQSQDLWETHSSSDSSNIFPSFFLACICSSNKTGIAFTHPPHHGFIHSLMTMGETWQWFARLCEANPLVPTTEMSQGKFGCLVVHSCEESLCKKCKKSIGTQRWWGKWLTTQKGLRALAFQRCDQGNI